MASTDWAGACRMSPAKNYYIHQNNAQPLLQDNLLPCNEKTRYCPGLRKILSNIKVGYASFLGRFVVRLIHCGHNREVTGGAFHAGEN